MANIIKIRKNGPMICDGKFILQTEHGDFTAENEPLYLCRCGHSENKPFCDGAHKSYAFDDLVNIHDEKPETLEDLSDEVVISLRGNAMLVVNGPVIIQTEDDASSTMRTKAALCRCGHSAKKPFCDISHKRCGFKS